MTDCPSEETSAVTAPGAENSRNEPETAEPKSAPPETCASEGAVLNVVADCPTAEPPATIAPCTDAPLAETSAINTNPAEGPEGQFSPAEDSAIRTLTAEAPTSETYDPEFPKEEALHITQAKTPASQVCSAPTLPPEVDILAQTTPSTAQVPVDNSVLASGLEAIFDAVLAMIHLNTNQKGGGGAQLYQDALADVRNLVAVLSDSNLRIEATRVLNLMDKNKKVNTPGTWRCYLGILLRRLGYEEEKLSELFGKRVLSYQLVEQAEAIVNSEPDSEKIATHVPKHGKRDLNQVAGEAEPLAKRATLESAFIQDYTTAAMQRLRKEGRLENSIQITGRDSSKKNASINGVYALIPGTFDGAPAYELIGRDATPRFLRYFAKKTCWKIRDRLDDGGSGSFAFVKAGVEKGMKPILPADLGPKAVWHVFDGKGEGHNEDPKVRCSKLNDRGDGGGGSESSPGPEVSPTSRRATFCINTVCTCLILEDGEELI